MVSPPFPSCFYPGPDWTIDYGVSSPWASKKFPIDLQWENGVSMLARSFFIKSSSKLLVTRTGRHVKWHENRGSVTKKQLWSRHTNFCKKVTKIPAVKLKGFFCKAVLVCRLCALKTLISLGTGFLYRVYPIRKPSVAEILLSLFIYTMVRDDPNDNRCTYNIDSQYCLLLNILGCTSFSDIKRI